VILIRFFGDIKGHIQNHRLEVLVHAVVRSPFSIVIMIMGKTSLLGDGFASRATLDWACLVIAKLD
jgi:hypothetical protein